MILNLADPLQSKLLDEITTVILKNATIQNGVIVNNTKNLSLVFKLNGIFREYQQELLGIAKNLTTDVKAINKLNFNYFKLVGDKGAKGLIKDKREVERYTRGLLGLNDDLGLKRGGFLDDFVTDPTVRQQAKRLALSSITGGNSLESFEGTMKDFLEGKKTKKRSS